ncbi:hypothetical protein NPIL_404551 [Nephila pilipes]|uniref:Uncharacterized protein n=1 Tax=Nephila pilipes TaxID=299642 RepID=A0A8X6QZF2_NEPPI|nr:hypothetical protein NPIL_404551 [Nephila pilipes]
MKDCSRNKNYRQSNRISPWRVFTQKRRISDRPYGIDRIVSFYWTKLYYVTFSSPISDRKVQFAIGAADRSGPNGHSRCWIFIHLTTDGSEKDLFSRNSEQSIDFRKPIKLTRAMKTMLLRNVTDILCNNLIGIN